MGQRGRFVLGGFLAAAGLAAWALVWWSIGPAGSVRPGVASSGFFCCLETAAHVTDTVWVMTHRWVAQLLALGGLLVLARGSTRAVAAAVGVIVAWVAADQVLDATGQLGVPAAVVTAVAVAGLMVAVGVLGRRPAEPDRAYGWLLGYVGVAIVAAPLAGRSAPGPAAGWALQAAAAGVGPLLALAAIVAALATRSRSSAGQWLTAGLIAAGVAASAVLTATWLRMPLSVGGPGDPTMEQLGWLILWRELIAGASVALVMAGAIWLFQRREAGLWRPATMALVSFPVLFGGSTAAITLNLRESRTVNLAIIAAVLPSLLYGLVLGAIAYALALVPVQPAARPVEASESAGSAEPGRRGFAVVGAGLALLGVAGWAITLAVVEPVVRANYARPNFYLETQADDSDSLPLYALWPKDLRWAAMVLAVGGLLLLLRGSHWRGRLIGAVVVAWVVVDVLLDRADVAGWPAAVAAWVGLDALLGGAIWLGRRHRHNGPTGSSLVLFYTAVAVTVARMLYLAAEPFMTRIGPPLLGQIAGALGPLLVLAAVVAALSVAENLSLVRVAAALLITVAGAAAVALYAHFQTTSQPDVDVSSWTVALGTGGLLTACVLLAGGFGRPRGWLAFASLALGLPAVAYGLTWGALAVGAPALRLVLQLTGTSPMPFGFLLVLGAVFAGGAFGALLLLPRVLAADPPPAVPPSPTPPSTVTPELSPAQA